MSKKIVTITFIADNDLTADEVKHFIKKHGYVHYKSEGDFEGYDDHYRNLSYGEAIVGVMEVDDDRETN